MFDLLQASITVALRFQGKASAVLGNSERDSEQALSSLNQEIGGKSANQFPPEKPG